MTLLFSAALMFALGGLFMKLSEGGTHLWPTIAFYVLFLAGAFLQARAMSRVGMGVVYIAVLGLEAAIAFAISLGYFRESYSLAKLVGVGLIVAGVALLRA